MDKNNSVEVRDLKKCYKLGAIGGHTLVGSIESHVALWRGKEDPNLKIGQKNEYGKKFWALNGISFDVKKGEAIGIIGHNGAEKSTLLKILSQITAPTDGFIDLRGRVSSMLEIGTGFHGEMTGRENIYMNAAILGMSRSEVDQKLDAIIDFSECSQFIDTPVKRYSSGMYVKLAFSVAAHLDSEILIMDEVLAVGDMRFQIKCLNKMREIVSKEGRTVLYVSHNMSTIRRLCDRCCVLGEGKLLYDGSVENGIRTYMNGIQKDNLRRSSSYYGEIVCFSSINIIDSFDNVFDQGDTLKIEMKIESRKFIRNLHIRLVVNYLGSSIAGSFFSEQFDIKKEVREFRLNIPLSVFPEGDFTVQTIISQTTEDGNFYDYDNIEQAVSFSVRPNKNNYAGMKWRQSWNLNLGTIPIQWRKI